MNSWDGSNQIKRCIESVEAVGTAKALDALREMHAKRLAEEEIERSHNWPPSFDDLIAEAKRRLARALDRGTSEEVLQLSHAFAALKATKQT